MGRVTSYSDRFLPWRRARHLPHVVVDSYPIRLTEICLSHWPSSGLGHAAKGASYRGDTSTEIVWQYLQDGGDVPRLPITSPHFDADGLFAAYMLMCGRSLDPDLAALLIEAAEVGDFGVRKSPLAVALSGLVDHWCDQKAGPLAAAFEGRARADQHDLLFARLLDMLPEWLDNVAGVDPKWFDAFQRSVEHRDRCFDEVARVEHPGDAAGLAWITVEDTHVSTDFPYFGLDPLSVHDRVHSWNIMVGCGSQYRIVQRYEGWVRLGEKPEALRPDLFGAQVPGSGYPNGYDGAHQMIPTLFGSVESQQDLAAFHRTLDERMPMLEERWDPYT